MQLLLIWSVFVVVKWKALLILSFKRLPSSKLQRNLVIRLRLHSLNWEVRLVLVWTVFVDLNWKAPLVLGFCVLLVLHGESKKF